MGTREGLDLLVNRNRPNLIDEFPNKDLLPGESKEKYLSPKLRWRLWFATVRDSFDKTADFRANIVVSACRRLRREEAESHEIIAKAAGLGGFALELQSSSLFSLPKSWFRNRTGDFVKIRRLTLINCGITDLPPSVKNCKWLDEIDLRQNNLFDLPEELGATYISKLCLDDNRFKAFPFVLTKLPTLTTLSMARNCMRRIPVSIVNLVRLKELHLQDNVIEKLPVPIVEGQLRCLELCTLTDNPLVADQRVLLECNEKYRFCEFVERPTVKQRLGRTHENVQTTKKVVKVVGILNHIENRAVEKQMAPNPSALLVEHIKHMDEVRQVSGLPPVEKSTQERMKQIREAHAIDMVEGGVAEGQGVDTLGLSSLFRRQAVSVAPLRASDVVEEVSSSDDEDIVASGRNTPGASGLDTPIMAKTVLPKRRHSMQARAPLRKSSSDGKLPLEHSLRFSPEPGKQNLATVLSDKLSRVAKTEDGRAVLDKPPLNDKRRMSLPATQPKKAQLYGIPSQSECPSPDGKLGKHPAPWMNNLYQDPELQHRKRNVAISAISVGDQNLGDIVPTSVSGLRPSASWGAASSSSSPSRSRPASRRNSLTPVSALGPRSPSPTGVNGKRRHSVHSGVRSPEPRLPWSGGSRGGIFSGDFDPSHVAVGSRRHSIAPSRF